MLGNVWMGLRRRRRKERWRKKNRRQNLIYSLALTLAADAMRRVTLWFGDSEWMKITEDSWSNLIQQKYEISSIYLFIWILRAYFHKFSIYYSSELQITYFRWLFHCCIVNIMPYTENSHSHLITLQHVTSIFLSFYRDQLLWMCDN